MSENKIYIYIVGDEMGLKDVLSSRKVVVFGDRMWNGGVFGGRNIFWRIEIVYVKNFVYIKIFI